MNERREFPPEKPTSILGGELIEIDDLREHITEILDEIEDLDVSGVAWFDEQARANGFDSWKELVDWLDQCD